MPPEYRPPVYWDPKSFSYQPSATSGFDPLAQGYFATEMMDVPQERKWAAAVGAALPGYTDNPFIRRAINRLEDPLYGEFWARSGGEDPGPDAFAAYAGERLRNIGTGWGAPGSLPGQTAPGNWQDVLNAARIQGVGYTGPGYGELGISDTRQAIAESLLKDPSALVNLATWNPNASTIRGRMRQDAINRIQERFAAGTLRGTEGSPNLGGPMASNVDWLAYITDPARDAGLNMVRPGYGYGPQSLQTDTGSQTAGGGGGSLDPELIGWNFPNTAAAYAAPAITLPSQYNQALYRVGDRGFSVQGMGLEPLAGWVPIAWN